MGKLPSKGGWFRAVPKPVLTALLIVPFLVSQAFAQTLYVKRDGVDLRQSTSRSSAVVQKLNTGDQVTVLSSQGVNYEVRTATGQVGYVSRLHVTEDRPRTSGRSGFGLQDTTGPSERSSVTSIRGLSPIAEEYADGSEINEQAVEDAKKMEDIAATVTDAEVDAFLVAGGVTPP